MGSSLRNWAKCADSSYRGANEENRKECAIEVSSIWPGTVSQVEVQLMNPPTAKMEYAAVLFSLVGPKPFVFSTDQSSASGDIAKVHMLRK